MYNRSEQYLHRASLYPLHSSSPSLLYVRTSFEQVGQIHWKSDITRDLGSDF
jgi:hypothetical protein